MKISIESNKYLAHFFKKYKAFAAPIKEDIKTRLPLIIAQKPYKIKNAGKIRHNNHQALEYKITVGKESFRAAFTFFDDTVTVFFISEKTVKAQFVAALEKCAAIID